MELNGRVVVVTGAASGIGEAMARRFAADGARAVIVADVDADGLDRVAADIDATPVPTDVSQESAMTALIEQARAEFGEIDIFCSNAGISVFGGAEADNGDWQRIWDVNVMAHVYAARALLPAWIERGDGYLVNTASAAGLLTQIGSAPYSVTKHAAVGLAEWLAITHGPQGIKVSVLCPQGVRTAMTNGLGPDGSVVGLDGMLEPGEVADAVAAAIEEERFLILPHPEVATYFQNKANDYGRWIGGMKKLQTQFSELLP